MTELERCLPWIKQALKRSGNRDALSDVLDNLANGHAQLWPLERGFIITQIAVYCGTKALRVWLAGGELDQITGLTEDATRFAKANGCAFAEFEGRPGWEKPLKKLGWKRDAVRMRLELR